MRPFLRIPSGNGQPSLFDGDLEALPCFKPGVLDPFPGELHPQMQRSVFLRPGLPFLVAP